MQGAPESIPIRAPSAADHGSSCPVPCSRRSFAQRTPTPNPQSQSFSRSYGSILPTSLIYIVLSTRGYSPWRPDAVMSTTGGANKSLHQIFKGLPERTERDKGYPAIPAIEPYLRANRFHGDRRLKRKENSSRGSGGRLWFRLRCRTISTSRFRNINLIPFR